MKKLLLLISMLLFTAVVLAQFAKAHFSVIVPDTKGQDVFIAGSFNGWQPSDSLYKLHSAGNSVWEIDIPVFKDHHYEYKYALGSWSRVELSQLNQGISNRYFISSKKNNTIRDTVRQWQGAPAKADSTERQKQFTAMKDSLVKKMQPVLGDIMMQFQAGITNMLQANPSAEQRQEIKSKIQANFSLIFQEIDGLIWKLASNLTLEQKAQVLKAIKEPSKNTDAINTFLNALQGIK